MTRRITFLDAAHNIVPEAQARWKVITELEGEKVKVEAWIDLKRAKQDAKLHGA